MDRERNGDGDEPVRKYRVQSEGRKNQKLETELLGTDGMSRSGVSETKGVSG